MSFLALWSKRKEIVIAHSDDGALTNYQVRLDIGESAGSNFSSLKYAGLGASAASGIYDDDAWVTPTNIYSDNAAYASVTAATFDTNDYTEVLKATTFGFAIPILATVKGIKVEIEKYRANANVVDECVQLTKDGTARVGNNKGDTVTNWGTAATVVTYGGANDLWGDTWTPAQINAATFGVHFVARALGEDADVYVDYVRITVYYGYVDCEGEIASDFSDLRFTTADGTTLCDYWIESLSGTTPNQLASVWVEVPSVAAHPMDTSIYMYYSGTHEAVSNGSNTFRFFDDFLGSSLSTDKWEGTGVASAIIAGSQMTLQGWTVNTKVDFASPVAARLKSVIYQPSGFAQPTHVGFEQPNAGSTNGFVIYEDRFANNMTWIAKASALKQINTNWTKAASQIQELKWNKTAVRVDFLENDVARSGSPDTTAANIMLVDTPFCFYTVVGSGGYGQVIVDWLAIRNLTLNEPYAATYGIAVGVPLIETDSPTPSKSSVMGHGDITYDGGNAPTIRGFCYKQGSTGEPLLETDLEVHEHGSFAEGGYSLNVTGLIPNTDYRIRAYCTNPVGTGYGVTVTVHTLIAATYVEILTSDRALSLDNEDIFTPTGDYQPATKKYADSIDGGSVTGLNNTAIMLDLNGGGEPSSIASFLDNTAGGTDGLTTKAPTSNVLYDHAATVLNAHGVGALGFRLNSKVKVHSRDLTAVTADIAYTGAGFQPSAILLLAAIPGGIAWSIGFSDSAKSGQCIYQYVGSVVGQSGYLGVVYPASAAYQTVVVKSYDADGCTLTWTKVNSPTGTAYFILVYLV